MAEDRDRDPAAGDDDFDGGSTVVGTWETTDLGRRLVAVPVADVEAPVATAREVDVAYDPRVAESTIDPSASTDEVRFASGPTSSADATRARDREEALASERLVAGRYRVGRVLGAGGMGTVFEAVHVGLGKRVALKVLAPFFEREGEAVARFLREARAASRIESDHIAQVFDVGEDLHLGLYMVMELLRGEDLARVLASRTLRPEEAAGIAWQVALALERAHEAGVVHRDLKPANVFLALADDGSLKVKVLDFGVAKLVRDAQELEQKAITRAGTAVGTPLYMAPEQAQGSAAIDHRADVYALGAVLFECVAGSPPYPEGEPYERTLYRILQEPAPRLSSRVPGVPPALDALVASMMARDPAARPPSAADVRARLAAIFPSLRRRALFLDASPSLAAPSVPPSLRPPPPRTASAVILESRVTSMPPAARRVTTSVLVALAVMLLGSIAIALVLARDPTPLGEASALATGAPPPLEAVEAPSLPTGAVAAPPNTGTAALAGDPPSDPLADAKDALLRGDVARARDLAIEGLRRSSTDPEVWLTLGAAHEALGETDAAKRAYEACVRGARGAGVAECRARAAAH